MDSNQVVESQYPCSHRPPFQNQSVAKKIALQVKEEAIPRLRLPHLKMYIGCQGDVRTEGEPGRSMQGQIVNDPARQAPPSIHGSREQEWEDARSPCEDDACKAKGRLQMGADLGDVTGQ